MPSPQNVINLMDAPKRSIETEQPVSTARSPLQTCKRRLGTACRGPLSCVIPVARKRRARLFPHSGDTGGRNHRACLVDRNQRHGGKHGRQKYRDGGPYGRDVEALRDPGEIERLASLVDAPLLLNVVVGGKTPAL